MRCRQKPLTERILDGSIPEPNTGCWLWIGSVRPDAAGASRGRLSIGDRTQLAYRASYEAFVGLIPAGLEIDHKCRLPLCVNKRLGKTQRSCRRCAVLHMQVSRTRRSGGQPS